MTLIERKGGDPATCVELLKREETARSGRRAGVRLGLPGRLPRAGPASWCWRRLGTRNSRASGSTRSSPAGARVVGWEDKRHHGRHDRRHPCPRLESLGLDGRRPPPGRAAGRRPRSTASSPTAPPKPVRGRRSDRSLQVALVGARPIDDGIWLACLDALQALALTAFVDRPVWSADPNGCAASSAARAANFGDRRDGGRIRLWMANFAARGAEFGRVARRAGWFFSGMAVLAVCLMFRWYARRSKSATAKPPASPGQDRPRPAERRPNRRPRCRSAPSTPKKNPVAAHRQQRADHARRAGPRVPAALRRRSARKHGQSQLIQAACQQRNIDDHRQASRRRNRSHGPQVRARPRISGCKCWKKSAASSRRYAHDIIWPTLALRELAKTS